MGSEHEMLSLVRYSKLYLPSEHVKYKMKIKNQQKSQIGMFLLKLFSVRRPFYYYQKSNSRSATYISIV